MLKYTFFKNYETMMVFSIFIATSTSILLLYLPRLRPSRYNLKKGVGRNL